MRPGAGCLSLCLLSLVAASQDGGQKKGKAGFCPTSPQGLYEPPCHVGCEGDVECPGDQKCCELACNYRCTGPSAEKAGLCPPPPMKKLHGPPACEAACRGDHDCHGSEKCCETGCGHACLRPLEERPGKCPRRQRVKTPLDGGCRDTCVHDQECPPGEKCCFTGCSMGCAEAH